MFFKFYWEGTGDRKLYLESKKSLEGSYANRNRLQVWPLNYRPISQWGQGARKDLTWFEVFQLFALAALVLTIAGFLDQVF